MMEKEIVACGLKSRESYSLIEYLLDFEDDISTPPYRILLKEMGSIYKKDEDAQNVIPDALKGKLKRKYRGKSKELVEIVDELTELSVSNIQIVEEIKNAKIHSISSELALALHNNHNDPDIPHLWERLAELRTIGIQDRGKNEVGSIILYGGDDLALLARTATEERPISTGIESFDKRLGGGLCRQRHYVFFGRPEIGKSSFSVFLSTNVLRTNLESKVLYLSNEDPAKAILERHMQCFLAKSHEELVKNYEQALVDSLHLGMDRLLIGDSPDSSVAEIQKIIAREKVDVVIIDQLRNIQSRDGTANRVNQLDEVARAARHLAKSNNIAVISITQAGDSAENKAELTPHDVDSSKTGIPGAACLMFGIGATKTMLNMGFRRISIPKNKITGDKTPFDVKIDELKCQFEET